MGLAGKTHGKCYNITSAWTKAAPHSAPTSPWRGTSNSFPWCCAHLPKPFCPAHLGQGSSNKSRQETTSLPCWGALWPSFGHLATPQHHVGEHCLAFTQSSQICALKGAHSSSPMLSIQLSNPAGIRHGDASGAAGPHQHQGPSPSPSSHGELFLPQPGANTRGMNPALTAHGLQSSIKVIKLLQGRAGSLAQGWRQRPGHRLCWVLATVRASKGCSCPLLCCSGVLGRCSCPLLCCS